MDRYRIILADDHPLLRQGLKKIIHENGVMKVIGEAGDGMELLKLLPKTNPDLVIIDISMPKLRGIEAIPKIKTIHPQVKILILSMHGDKEYLCQAISAGADGYLLKEDADSELFNAIETIFQNKIYISPMLADLTREDWVDRCRQKDKPFTVKNHDAPRAGNYKAYCRWKNEQRDCRPSVYKLPYCRTAPRQYHA